MGVEQDWFGYGPKRNKDEDFYDLRVMGSIASRSLFDIGLHNYNTYTIACIDIIDNKVSKFKVDAQCLTYLPKVPESVMRNYTSFYLYFIKNKLTGKKIVRVYYLYENTLCVRVAILEGAKATVGNLLHVCEEFVANANNIAKLHEFLQRQISKGITPDKSLVEFMKTTQYKSNYGTNTECVIKSRELKRWLLSAIVGYSTIVFKDKVCNSADRSELELAFMGLFKDAKIEVPPATQDWVYRVLRDIHYDRYRQTYVYTYIKQEGCGDSVTFQELLSKLYIKIKEEMRGRKW